MLAARAGEGEQHTVVRASFSRASARTALVRKLDATSRSVGT